MELLIIGGDMRCAHLARLMDKRGMDVRAIGLEKALVPLDICAGQDALEDAECALLTQPFMQKDGMVFAPLSERRIKLETVWQRLPRETKLLLIGAKGMPEDFERKAQVVDILEDEAFAQRNARPTAEGAIHAAMSELDSTLSGNACLVIGYGRIGRVLARMLKGLGARVTVAARREESRAQAEADGHNAVDMGGMECMLAAQKVIFSTPPQLVMGEKQLSLVDKGALVIDLASPPYGVDLEAAAQLDVKAWRESALPGRYSPVTASEILMRTIQCAMENEGRTY